MSIKQVAQQAMELNQQLHAAAKKAFEIAKAAGLILDEQRDDDGDYAMLPSNRDWKMDDYELDSTGIDIACSVYAGCGDYDHSRIHIPYEAFDNMDAWIAGKKAEYAEDARKRAKKKAAEEAEEQRKTEEAERKHFLELKEKFEGAKQ